MGIIACVCVSQLGEDCFAKRLRVGNIYQTMQYDMTQEHWCKRLQPFSTIYLSSDINI